MDVFGEPVGRQVVAGAAFLGLAVEQGAGGGELVAETDIVDEAGNLAVGTAAFGAAGDQLGQRRQRVEIDVARHLPAMAVGRLGHDQILGHGVDRLALVGVDDDAVGALDRLGFDLGPLDRGQVNARFDPVLEENRIDRVVAHMTMSAPLIASSGVVTGVTAMPSVALISCAKVSRFCALGLKQRMVSIGRTAQAAISWAPACQPEPRMPIDFAFCRARYLTPSPLAAPTRMRCMTPSGKIASGSPVALENNSTRPT